MIKNVFKSIIFLCILFLFVFCSIQVFSEGARNPVKGGKVSAEYLETDAYSEKRLAEGKATFEAKCAICHTDSGRDMVYFGDPDFNAARVIGSVKKFAGASDDPEIGEKVYEYLRYNNDGPFMSQDDPIMQPGPLKFTPGVINPVLSKREDFWGSLTGHKIPTPDDINIEKIWDSYDWTNVILPYELVNWAEYMPYSVPHKEAVNEIKTLFNKQRYNLNNLPLPDKGLGRYFNYSASRIYDKYQFASHSYAKSDNSKDFLEAVYSTSLAKWLAVLNFEYGLPQRVNGAWNGEWEFGPHENTILWEPGENLNYINSFAINPDEKINSREAMRNQWTQFSTMFVTGKRGSFEPSTYFHYGTMPWGCKMGDAGIFGGSDVQIFTGLKGFADFWNHSKTYPGVSYSGTNSIPDYGIATRRFLTAFYWPYTGFTYYWKDKETVVNPFIELIYRQWMASIGATDDELRDFLTDTYNLPSRNNDGQRYELLVKAYENLQDVMTNEQKDFVKAYIRRIYPTNPTGYKNSFNPYKWELVDPAPAKPVLIPFGSDTAVAEKPYVLRIIRAQSKDGDIEITASGLPDGAKLVKREGSWRSDDYEYSINWTPTKAQSGKVYTVNLSAKSNMGTNQISTQINVVSAESSPVLDDIPSYSVYEGQELTFPLTVQNHSEGSLEFSMEGSLGKVMNNTWNTAGIFTVTPEKNDVGTHTITFSVKDKRGNVSKKNAKITVKANSKPVIQISPDGSGPGGVKNIYTVKVGETLRLTIKASDADGDELEISKTTEFPGYINSNVYTYKVEEDMAKYFPGPNVLTFTVKDLAPDKNPWFSMSPEYKGGMAKKVLLVYFEPEDSSSNHTPWAIAGSPQTVNSGQRVTLDGTGSDDTDKDTIEFQWSQVSGTQVELSNASSATPSFIAPEVSTTEILKFYLIVTDPGGLSDSNVVRVKVNGSSIPNDTPTVRPTVRPTVTPTIKATVTPTAKATVTVTPTAKATVIPTVGTTATVVPTSTAVSKVTPTGRPVDTNSGSNVAAPPYIPPVDTPFPTAIVIATHTPMPTPVKASTLGTPPSHTPINSFVNRGDEPIAFFSDLRTHWASNYISALVSKGVIGGYPDGTIKPDMEITRAEAVKVIVSSIKLEPSQNPVITFSDKDRIPEWVQGYLHVAIEKGIITGFEDNTFRPDKKLSRQEMATLIVKAYKFNLITNGNMKFLDSNQIPNWSRAFIATANNRGIIQGYSDGSFRPDKNITRAETFTIVAKCMDIKSD